MEVDRKTLALGAFLGGTAVVFGALGAHALRDSLVDAHAWDIGVRYHAWHALALVALAALPRHGGTALRVLFGLGVLVFSGSLYLFGLGELPDGLRMATPIGGLILLVGWIVLLARALRRE